MSSTTQLFEQKVVAQFQVNFDRAKLLKAEGELKEAEADLFFTNVRAEYDGIIDRQMLSTRKPRQGRGRAHDALR